MVVEVVMLGVPVVGAEEEAVVIVDVVGAEVPTVIDLRRVMRLSGS